MSKDNGKYKPYYDNNKYKDTDPFADIDERNYNWNSHTPPSYPPPKIEYPNNFVERKNNRSYVFIEHLVTRERKWVAKSAIYRDGVASAFYDADPKFAPEEE